MNWCGTKGASNVVIQEKSFSLKRNVHNNVTKTNAITVVPFERIIRNITQPGNTIEKTNSTSIAI